MPSNWTHSKSSSGVYIKTFLSFIWSILFWSQSLSLSRTVSPSKILLLTACNDCFRAWSSSLPCLWQKAVAFWVIVCILVLIHSHNVTMSLWSKLDRINSTWCTKSVSSKRSMGNLQGLGPTPVGLSRYNPTKWGSEMVLCWLYLHTLGAK